MFEGTVRQVAVDSQTGQNIPPANTSQYPPERLKMEMQPRIRCLDCPGKLYTPGSEMCENFEVHLKNRGHREKVEERMKRSAAGGGEAMFVSR